MKLEDVIKGTYTIENGLVNVQGDVDLSNKNLKKVAWSLIHLMRDSNFFKS